MNFCKFTNETRLAIEDASAHSGLKFLAALNGICAGGGYELALACDEIVLVDDGNSAVSLPEAPLLGVLPGTGGLTRVVDKRHVRRDLADFFSTLAEGVKGKRAVEWRLVDAVYPTSQFKEAVQKRARELAATSDRPASGPGITLNPLNPTVTDGVDHVLGGVADVQPRQAHRRPDRAGADRPAAVDAGRDPRRPAISSGRCARSASSTTRCCGCASTSRRSAPSSSAPKAIATRCSRSTGRSSTHQSHWLVREIVHFMKRTLKRVDLTARSFFALIEPGSAFAGSLFELALAADRSYMFHDDDEENVIALSPMNAGPLPMSNGLTRLQTRFLGEPRRSTSCSRTTGRSTPPRREEAGLVTFAPDEIDWDDEVRAGGRSARGVLARRADRPGSEPALRRPRDDGDEDLRPADGLAELDLPAAERRRRERRADGLRPAGQAGVRLEADVD